MLLERNQVVIGLVVAVLISVGAVVAILATSGGFLPGKRVSAYFEDAAGLRAQDFVFVAGVRKGQVDRVTVEGGVVRVDFKLDADVPADSGATIILQNALGKRGIRILPGTSAQLLEQGDVIPVERTSTPVDFPELGDDTVDLLGTTDVDALNAVAGAVADITDGARRQVADLLDGVERLSALISERRDELAQVLERTEVIVDAAAAKDREIVRIIDAFGSTLDRLAVRRADIQRLLRETATSTAIAADLVSEERTKIDRVLADLHQDLQVVDANQVDLAHLLAYAGVGVEGFASIGYQGGAAKQDNPAWGNVFTTGLGQVGVDALLGCGGALDEVLSEILGPDPQCDGTAEQPSGTQAADTSATSPTLRRSGALETFFSPVLRLGGRR